jgi:hypothetical protein
MPAAAKGFELPSARHDTRADAAGKPTDEALKPMKVLWLGGSILLFAAAASAHVNDRGMNYRKYKDGYGQSCCDNRDCRPAADFVETVVDGRAVVRLLIEGTWITVSRSYVVSDAATDGRAHFCGRLHRPGRNPSELKAEPICVILPPRQA